MDSYGLIIDYYLQSRILVSDLSNYKGMKSIHASSFFQSVEGLTHRNTQPFRITSNHNPNACLQTVRGSREKTCRTPHRKPQLSRGFKPRTCMLWGDKVNHCLPKRCKKWSEMKPKPFFKHLKHVISGNLLLQDLAHWCGDNNGNISFPTSNH